ncbi:pyridoxal phosphate-dependent aminotransferase [Bifidobacterium oedipodis]|uniref:Aspartate aminotransferase n=1 Tax=Bifidobacterium oedipodis TaxID=2675322 RepID=A0A7Y0ENC2_9BIFI|nr:pyridoxal phosphate-dependent aminotransferase [Bifidobacterium sp. DSM 109957]NMM93440.1 aspartate aminotransferase [Bifidobacterium sp. DSM 109957]
MINEEYKAMLGGKSVIRELAEYATARGKEIGYDNVFDYSLGNPSVPAPASFTAAMTDLYAHGDPVALHGYSPSLGNPEFKQAVADYLNRKFAMAYTANHIFPTTGAAGALSHAFRAVTKPDDEIVTFAPYFPEYGPYTAGAGLKLTVVPADTTAWQIDFAAFEQALNPNVTAVLINTPNNPSGAVYSAATLEKLASILTAKQAEYGHDIFLISDEPYREILFDGGKQPYPSTFYDNTLSCYSWSKSLSLPGERIGYVAVNPKATDADLLVPMMGQISRGTGHNCPASSIQLGVAKVLDETSDLSVYETNMNLLYDALTSIGFDVVRPGGTFYIFPKALEENATAFCMKAKEYDLILVPSESFGVPGYFRMAYCIDTDKVKRSIPALERFAHEVYGK